MRRDLNRSGRLEINDGIGLHERNSLITTTFNPNGRSRLHRGDHLALDTRGEHNLGAVAEQKSLHLAARVNNILTDYTLSRDVRSAHDDIRLPLRVNPFHTQH